MLLWHHVRQHTGVDISHHRIVHERDRPGIDHGPGSIILYGGHHSNIAGGGGGGLGYVLGVGHYPAFTEMCR